MGTFRIFWYSMGAVGTMAPHLDLGLSNTTASRWVANANDERILKLTGTTLF